MITFIYDATFEGLLTAMYFAYKEKNECRIAFGSNYQLALDDSPIYIETDYDIYNKMENYISGRCGIENLMSMYKAYLGELPGISTSILNFFRIALKKGIETQYMHVNPCVLQVLNAEKTVVRESQKMQGFIRFKKVSANMLYAPYQPTSNITPLVAGHFADRMNSYKWIIHDTNRGVYAVYNGKSCIIGRAVPKNLPAFKDIDQDYEKLWVSYTKSVAIKERKNLKFQMSLMPKKYWGFLTEMNHRTS